MLLNSTDTTNSTEVLTDTVSLVRGARPRHLPGLHDDLNGESLHLLPEHGHDNAHLHVPFDHTPLVLGDLPLLPPEGHVCSCNRRESSSLWIVQVQLWTVVVTKHNVLLCPHHRRTLGVNECERV